MATNTFDIGNLLPGSRLSFDHLSTTLVMRIQLLLLLFMVGGNLLAQCDPNLIFSNDTSNAVCVVVGERVRTIYANNLPNHAYGTWPSGNPVSSQDLTYQMCAFPQKASSPISIYDSGDFMGCSPYIEFGLALNGVRMAPFGARWFVNPNNQQENRDWNVEALVMFSMDFNNSHSNPAGQYHYHGIPTNYFGDSLGIDGATHSPLVGFAADGFPIYYKYLYSDPNDPSGGVSAFDSGHSLKPGNRPGNGITAPNGPYDGLYVEDYEFLDSDWALDECNGRFGVTPEYPNGTYYYVMTDSWPYIPRCFYGTVVDNSFRIGMNCPSSSAAIDCSAEITSTIAILEDIEVRIAPNPSRSSLRILCNKPDFYTNIGQLSIYDLNAKVWYQSDSYTGDISLSNLPAGTYFLQIDVDKMQVTKKLIVQR